LYEIRNKLIHSYKEDISIITNEDDVIKKMGAIWEKISSMIVSLFGDDAIKTSIPKKKYLDVELEAALKEEVRKKIDSRSPYSTIMRFADASISFAPENIKDSYGLSEYSPPGEDICPRCGHLTLARRNNYSSYFAHKLTTSGDLYFCRKCNLELTKRELEMAREIRHGEM